MKTKYKISWILLLLLQSILVSQNIIEVDYKNPAFMYLDKSEYKWKLKDSLPDGNYEVTRIESFPIDGDNEEDTIVRYKCIYASFLNGKKNGSYMEYSVNSITMGIVKTKEAFFLNSLKSGKYTEWYPNGQKLDEGYYSFGKKNGRWVFYEKNVQLDRIYNYKDDSLKSWALFIGGNVNCELKEGKHRDPMIIQYYPNGTVKRKVYYKGKKIRKVVDFDLKGNILKKAEGLFSGHSWECTFNPNFLCVEIYQKPYKGQETLYEDGKKIKVVFYDLESKNSK